ncbi:MAG TPA: hypothetical protein VER03_15335 [Bryobacteraceae bacterium]|nr:hypothetical protein [Bryobacteraceae bacterium]
MATMADLLYLSYTLRGFSNMNMLRHWERLLRVFPFSKLGQGGNPFQVHAVSFSEPALFETSFTDPLNIDAVLESAREFTGSDCAAQLEGKWDIWQYANKEWKLTPTRVLFTCFATGFEDSEPFEHLRVNFGPDSHFIPDPDLPNSLFMAQSNIRSLLHFVHEADAAVNAENRRLWTETGENFAERLQAALEEI